MTHPYKAWLEKHLADATLEYNRAQAADEAGGDDDSYEQVHQMWGYLAGLEKALKEFKAFEKGNLK